MNGIKPDISVESDPLLTDGKSGLCNGKQRLSVHSKPDRSHLQARKTRSWDIDDCMINRQKPAQLYKLICQITPNLPMLTSL